MASALLLVAGACGRAPEHSRVADEDSGTGAAAVALPIELLADSSRSRALAIEPPLAWVARVSPSPTAAIDAPLPDALPDAPVTLPPPPRLERGPGLEPPIAKRASRIAVPKDARLPAYVELEVRVDADGAVREVRWAGGDADTALIGAAIACARGMTFFPALRGGTPVEVWCRQRFDFPR